MRDCVVIKNMLNYSNYCHNSPIVGRKKQVIPMQIQSNFSVTSHRHIDLVTVNMLLSTMTGGMKLVSLPAKQHHHQVSLASYKTRYLKDR